MISSVIIDENIQKNAVENNTTPHITSQPVIYFEDDKYYLAAFTFFFNAEDIRARMMPRPTEWVICDIKNGNIVKKYTCNEKDFSKAPYDRKYSWQMSKPRDTSKKYLEDIAVLLDEIRIKIINKGKVDTTLYDKYLEMLMDNIPDDFRQFYLELGMNSLKKILHYSFKWEPANSLRNIDGPLLSDALKLMNSGYIKEIKQETRDKIKIFKKRNVNVCGEKDIEKIIEEVKNDNSNEYDFVEFNSDREIVLCANSFDCPWNNCLIKLAGYLQYLDDIAELDAALNDRKMYRKKLGVSSTPFGFKWTPQNGLKFINDKTYNLANELINLKAVRPLNSLNLTGGMDIVYKNICKNIEFPEIGLTSPEAATILKTQKSLSDQLSKTLSNEKCARCTFDVCPFEVAGYIQYLKATGQESVLEGDRSFHVSNSLKTKKVEKKRAESLSLMVDKNPEIADIINIANTKEENSLYCIIAGEKGSGKTILTNKIADLLLDKRKIAERQFCFCSFDQLAEMLTEYVGKKEQTKLLPGFNHFGLSPKMLYVLRGLDTFLEDYTECINGKSKASEEKRKRFKHLAKILGEYKQNIFIIIIGTEEDAKKFIGLNDRYKLLYGDNIIHLSGLSTDEVFVQYRDNLTENLSEKIKADEEKYKEEFKKYMSETGNNLPFKNTELAQFLAQYSNTKKEIVFPQL